MQKRPIIKRGQYLRKKVDLSVQPGKRIPSLKSGKKGFRLEELPEGQIRAMASTIEPDREEHLIIPSAFTKWLPAFLSNPVFLLNHEWGGSIENHLGSVLEAEPIDGEGLECLFDYDFSYTKTCKAVYQKTKKGSLRGYSIGFYVHDFVTLNSPEEKLNALPAYARQALKDGRCYIVFTEIELVEISAVYIPSNRGAVNSLSASLPDERSSQDVEQLEKVLAKMGEVQQGLKAEKDRGDSLEKSIKSMAEAVTGLTEFVKSTSQNPKPEPKAKSIKLEDLNDEDFQIVVDLAVKAVKAQMEVA